MYTFFLVLFLLTAQAFVTWWFLLGLLNPFIDSAYAIVKCALSTVFSFFFNPIVKLNKALEKTIIRPIHHAVQQIHIPKVMKAVFYMSLGVAIVILDQLYATKILAEDQAEFYNIVFRGKKYWITQVALLWGGIFVSLGALYAIDLILSGINKLLDRRVRLSIVVHK